MSKWIAEFDLEDGDTMPEHMELNYMGAKIDFHCRPMWIPVSERLPEENKEVLVYLNAIPYLAWFEDGKWRTEDFIINKDFEPKAWMPLPAPYKAESEDKE